MKYWWIIQSRPLKALHWINTWKIRKRIQWFLAVRPLYFDIPVMLGSNSNLYSLPISIGLNFWTYAATLCFNNLRRIFALPGHPKFACQTWNCWCRKNSCLKSQISFNIIFLRSAFKTLFVALPPCVLCDLFTKKICPRLNLQCIAFGFKERLLKILHTFFGKNFFLNN